jgi:DNA repair photolyase
METKKFKGKAIYTPNPAAAEYSKFVCNFYKGCSCDCEYCCNKRWGWGIIPTLKECFKDENHALQVFEKELMKNLPELQRHGLFFSISTDPMLKETMWLTSQATMTCVINGVQVKILTKRAEFVNGITDECGSDFTFLANVKRYFPHSEQLLKKRIAFGFTLTGHDEREPGASPNAERIKAMRKLHEAGFKTWASIEPVIDFESSFEMIRLTSGFCNLYKVGLESGKKYDKEVVNHFVHFISGFCTSKIYLKDSLLKTAGIDRKDLPSNCVGREYSLFNN